MITQSHDYKAHVKESLRFFNMSFNNPLAESVASNQIFSLHTKLNYPYGDAQQYIQGALTYCESPTESRSRLSLLHLQAHCSRINFYPLVQGVSDWVIKFCAPTPICCPH